MASTTCVSELPSSAAARCADARSVVSILIVRCGARRGDRQEGARDAAFRATPEGVLLRYLSSG
jgi:hypothetical protein